MTIIAALPAAQRFPTSEAALWLALATGCRIGELLRAEWQHVRLDAREWFIPGANSKNGKPHTIHLSDFALRHFAALQSINGASKWCFPNRDDSDNVIVTLKRRRTINQLQLANRNQIG